jgi:glycosyltransferase involved in cell wall biosynthesis
MGIFINEHTQSTYPIFNYDKEVFGGTESMAKQFHKFFKHKMPKLEKYNCFIIPGMTPEPIEIAANEKESIIWMHNLVNQFSEKNEKDFKDKQFLDKIKYLITVSEYHRQQTIESLGIDPEKVVVINNGIDAISFNPEKFNNPKKIKLIHTSSADRGMAILLMSLRYIKEDFELNIYNNFYPDIIANFEDRIKEVFDDPRVRFFGKTPKKTVVKALQDSHIFVYPTNFLDTFCLSQVEALSAGCFPVYSEMGSLIEVSGGYGLRYKYVEDYEKHAMIFAAMLKEAINKINNNEWDPIESSNYVNEKYSWDKIEKQWLDFHDKL